MAEKKSPCGCGCVPDKKTTDKKPSAEKSDSKTSE